MSKQFTNYKTACYLDARGFDYDYGQTWNYNPDSPHLGNRQDLFGFIDVLLFRPDFGILAVQACVATALAEHRRSIQNKKSKTYGWLKSGGLLYIFSWRKVKVKGREVWQPRIERAALRDGDARIRFYLVTDAVFELPGGASQPKPTPKPAKAKEEPTAKAPSVAGNVVNIQPAEVLKRRRALMLKRQAERSLAQNDNQQASPPPDPGKVA